MEQSKKTAITKEKILTAAEKEFANNGLAATRVDIIAKEAGVNKQMIYAHFESKEFLYSTVLNIVYERLSKFEKNLENREFTSIDTVRDIILEYFEFLVGNQSFVRLMLWENLNNAVYVKNIKTNLFSGIEKLLYQGIEKGFIRKDLDIEQTAMSFNMFCFSAFSNIHTTSKLLDKDLCTTKELNSRAQHIADVFTRYIV